MSLSVNIEKTLGSFHLKVQFEAENETLALLGASGCGKSLTLRCIAGIEKPDRGRIILDGVTLFDSEKKIDRTPQQRGTGFLFQNYALFPHMTVRQNIYAGANREKDKEKRKTYAETFIERFGLSELSDHYPHQLSGGQQQRVALARILVSDPKILLLDEPFSALDSHLRFQLEQEVRQVIRDFGRTVLLVSHDREEVFRMSDSIAVMDQGSVQVMGTKAEVFAYPKTKTAAILTGCKNISPAKLLDNGRIYADDWGIELEIPSSHSCAWSTASAHNSFAESSSAPVQRTAKPEITHLGIRAHDIQIGPGKNGFYCRVAEVIENPFSYTILLTPVTGKKNAGIRWMVDKAVWACHQAETIEVHLPPESLLLLKE